MSLFETSYVGASLPASPTHHSLAAKSWQPYGCLRHYRRESGELQLTRTLWGICWSPPRDHASLCLIISLFTSLPVANLTATKVWMVAEVSQSVSHSVILSFSQSARQMHAPNQESLITPPLITTTALPSLILPWRSTIELPRAVSQPQQVLRPRSSRTSQRTTYARHSSTRGLMLIEYPPDRTLCTAGHDRVRWVLRTAYSHPFPARS